MDPPSGFIIKGQDDKVCRLGKSFYWLKQSPRTWFDRFSKAVIRYKLRRCCTDHTVFVKKKKILVIPVYFVNIVVTGNDDDDSKNLKAYLRTEFKIKDLGAQKYFLEIEVARSKNGIVILQWKSIFGPIEETGKLGANPVDTPIEKNHALHFHNGEILHD